MEFSDDKNNNMNIYKGKELFEKLTLSATLGMLRGIDMNLYTETSNEMTNFIKEFQEILMGTKFSNKDLIILRNLLIQNRKVIKDLKQGENNE